MDVPCVWYKDLMLNQSLKSQLKRKAADYARRHIHFAYNIYQKLKKETRIETVYGVRIHSPSFRGFWADPDYFYKFNKYFEKVSVEVQPFLHKPVRYRKFRFNILMTRRNDSMLVGETI